MFFLHESNQNWFLFNHLVQWHLSFIIAICVFPVQLKNLHHHIVNCTDVHKAAIGLLHMLKQTTVFLIVHTQIELLCNHSLAACSK